MGKRRGTGEKPKLGRERRKGRKRRRINRNGERRVEKGMGEGDVERKGKGGRYGEGKWGGGRGPRK